MDLSGLDLSNLRELEVRAVWSLVSYQLKCHLCVCGQSQQLSLMGVAPLNGAWKPGPTASAFSVSQAATLTS